MVFMGYGSKHSERYFITAMVHRGKPVVWYRSVSMPNYKEDTPLKLLEEGISCPELHEYFAEYAAKRGYKDA